MTFDLASAHILCAPASYVLDGTKGGSEPLWAHNIVREIAARAESVTAVTGYVESSVLPPNVEILTAGGQRGQNFLAASVAARFTLQCGFVAARAFLRHRPAIFHHILPFGLGQTFNPIQPLLGSTPLVIGPVQGESYRKHFEQISLGGVETKQGAPTRQPLSNKIARSADPVLRTLNENFVRRADAVVAISEEAAAFLSNVIDPEKLHVIPPGVDCSLFTVRPQHSGNEITLLTAGYLLKRKRVDVILRALRILRDNNHAVRLIVAGDGPEREALKALAGALELEGAVQWLGFVENRSLPRVYHTADVFVSASEHEGLPTAFLEALASGLPLVCCDNPGSRAVITEEERGRVVAQEDPEGMAAAIAELTRSRPMLEIRSKHTRALAERSFDWRIVGDRYAEVYCAAALHRARR